MWEEQIASVVFVKRGKLGIFCEVLFWDGKRTTLRAPCFAGFRDVLEAIGNKGKNIKACTSGN